MKVLICRSRNRSIRTDDFIKVKKILKTHYENLQVLENASPEVIKGAYRFLSQKWHPDKNLENRAEAERVTCILNEAYAVLSDTQLRKEHDEWIRNQRGVNAAKDAKKYYSSGSISESKIKLNNSHGFFKRAWLMVLFTVAFLMLFILLPYQLLFGEFRSGYLIGVAFWFLVGRYSYTRLFGRG